MSNGIYNYALSSVTDANGCAATNLGTGITVTVTDNTTLTAGSIGTAQSICFNTVPPTLTQLTAPSGGDGTYTYQWQSSANNSTWTDISGATLSTYSPPALTASTYFRRTVISGILPPVYSASVRITVFPQITLAQLHDNISIYSGTSTNINVAITGGTAPFTVSFTRNGVAQSPVTNYTSGSGISTGTLSNGVYNYALTSVTDANGCSASSLGTGITVTVTDKPVSTYIPVDSLFRTQTPAYSGNDRAYELGSEFQTRADGFITKVRLFTHVSETGNHTIRLWVLNGSTYSLLAGPYTWNFSAGTHGWRQYPLTTPIAVQTSKTYIISITNGTDLNYEKSENFPANTSNTYVRYTRGVYSTTLGTAPTQTYASSCYFRDVVFSITNRNGNLTAGTIGTAQSICYNTVPAPLTQLTAPSGGDGTYTYQWQSSANNSTWTNISGATMSTYAPPALLASTYFRRTVTSGSYTPVNSTSVLKTVFPQITLAQLHDNITIDNNASANINVTITGGTAPFTVNFSRNGIPQSPVTSYTSGSNISTGILTTGVYNYTLTAVTDANGCSATSLGTAISVTVTEYSALTAGSIGTAQSICYNTLPAQLTQLTAPSGGDGTYTYQWQNSANNSTWTDITGATMSTYAPPELMASTYFRRTVISGILAPVYSASVRITVYPQITLAQLHDDITINNNSSANINVTITGGTAPFTINFSRNGIPQSPVTSYTSGSTISTGILTTGIYNYSLTSVTDANGCAATNLGTGIAVTVTEYTTLTAGSIGTAQSICYNTVPAQLTELTAPSGGNGTYTYQWQSSANNSTWTDISGATLSTYSPPALSASTYFRRTVISGILPPVYSASVRITVFPQITLAQLHDNISIYSGTSTNINVAITGGTAPFTVSFTRNGVAQSPVTNYTSGSAISTGTLSNGVYNYALTSVTDANGCSASSLGTGITVTVTDKPVSIYSPVDSLFRTQTPAYSGNDRAYELGSEFQTRADGFITKVRLFTHASETGNHTIRLWVLNGSTYSLLAGPYTWNFSAGTHGWRQYPLTTPIAVQTSKTYIISITNGTDLNYEKSENFPANTSNTYVRYTRGVYSTTLGTVPTQTYASSCYFRDVVFSITNGNGNLTAGTIGTAQSICYNTVPAPLTQLTAPSGGDGTYTYQWQSSANNSTWTNISGATMSTYAPPALLASTYFRRTVTSGSYTPVYSASVLKTVSPQITLAQLHDNMTISSNTSTNINVSVSGGTSPFSVSYTLNGVGQSDINNYTSGSNISTGVLATGVYNYVLTYVTDANNCSATSLGTPITVTAAEGQNVVLHTNKALVLINSTSSDYSDFANFVSPYLDNFGIPYDQINISSTQLPDFNNYAVIIFGHNNVYQTGYPITQLESAVSSGVGLYSFDAHLFDYSSGFNSLITQASVSSTQINVSNTTHYITQMHANDTYNSSNNVVNLLESFTATQKSRLTGGTDLATMTSGSRTIPLLQVATYGSGRIVKWTGYDWISVNVLGPIYGMDDLVWRGIVWAARKPFAMQGLPPMITMRVDDVQGYGSNILDNFEWVSICNEFGILPWLGTFNHELIPSYIPTLKYFIDNNKATASPHAFGSNPEFIYFNHYGESPFDIVENTREAKEFYDQNGLKISKYFIPHYYEVSSQALSGIQAMGGEFLGIHMLPDNLYFGGPRWINCGPYRLNNEGPASNEYYPVYYGGYVNLGGRIFFNCLTEIRDDGTYEWYPDNNVTTTTARGIRHLRRALNSMVLPSLFTHERYFGDITSTNFREILRQITTSVSGYNPEYTTTDYAVKYIRAKTNIKITGIKEMVSQIEISYNGSNDMDTKCYLFNEQNGQITYRLIGLPQTSGSNVVNVIK